MEPSKFESYITVEAVDGQMANVFQKLCEKHDFKASWVVTTRPGADVDHAALATGRSDDFNELKEQMDTLAGLLSCIGLEVYTAIMYGVYGVYDDD